MIMVFWPTRSSLLIFYKPVMHIHSMNLWLDYGVVHIIKRTIRRICNRNFVFIVFNVVWWELLDWLNGNHDDVIKWKHFPRYWPFVRGIHRSPVNSPHKGQWRGALVFSLICVWINGWVNNGEAGELTCYRAHYDVTVMLRRKKLWWCSVDIWWRHDRGFPYYWAFRKETHRQNASHVQLWCISWCYTE